MNPLQTSTPDNHVNTQISTDETRKITYAVPVWRANRHEHGVDLCVELPGVSRSDLDLEVVGSQLRLEATRPVPENSGSLTRGVPAPEGYRLKLRLGETLDGNNLSASLEDGVLRLTVPLIETAKPRKVEIA